MVLCEWDAPEGDPGQSCVHLFARILSTSFSSVSTVSKGHPFIVSLADTSTEPYADNAVYECLTLSYSLQDPVFK